MKACPSDIGMPFGHKHACPIYIRAPALYIPRPPPLLPPSLKKKDEMDPPWHVPPGWTRAGKKEGGYADVLYLLVDGCRNYIGRNYIGRNYTGHIYTGHDCIPHNYIDHNCTGHNYIWP